MPVDPQIQALLDLRAKLPPLHTLSVADARLQMAARDILGLRKPEIASVIDRDMQGPGGSQCWPCAFTRRAEQARFRWDGVLPWQRVRAVQPGYA